MFPAWCSEFGSGGKFKSPSQRWSGATWATLEGPTTDALIRYQLLDRRQGERIMRGGLPHRMVVVDFETVLARILSLRASVFRGF